MGAHSSAFRAPSWGVVAAIWWAVCWRTVAVGLGGGLVCIFLASFAGSLLGTRSVEIVGTIAAIVLALVALPFAIRGALRKRYAHFELRVISTDG